MGGEASTLLPDGPGADDAQPPRTPVMGSRIPMGDLRGEMSADSRVSLSESDAEPVAGGHDRLRPEAELL